MRDIVRFGADGLVPAVVQDAVTGDVLMVAFMNEEAVRLTRESGRTHFWSRGRGALWRKGETSGNHQIVTEIRVNCEENSLLILVRQIGAVCHTGHPTCYFRRLEPDGTLTIVRERVFDPKVVYGTTAAVDAEVDASDIDGFAETTRLQYGAYAYLRDHDLTDVSATSRQLRTVDAPVRQRVADELRELAGVLDGEHHHVDAESDLRLEASQVLYWLILSALRDGVTWSRLRPDRALRTATDGIAAKTVASMLRAEADRWAASRDGHSDLAVEAHSAIAFVGQACRIGNVDPASVVDADLAELRGRSYLALYFRESGNTTETHRNGIPS
jgi:phosphoribosyl-AMP cyclohydrolase